MYNTIEVKEFDQIISNKNFANDDHYIYIDDNQFRSIESFISNFSEETALLDFMNISYKKNVGKTITIKNFVGLIKINNKIQIHVLPKVHFNNKDDINNAKTKLILTQMLRTLKDFPCKDFNTANLKIDKMNLYEIFISMYINEVRQLIKSGIKSSYLNSKDNLHFFKGKLLVKQQLKLNLTHKERFFVEFDEYHPNRSENRIIKSTLLKLQQNTTSSENSKEIKQILPYFELVNKSNNYIKDFSKINLDRNTNFYHNIIKWSKVFLMNKSFTSFSGKIQSQSLLFPMEKLFESYVTKKIKEIFSPEGWTIYTQNKGNYLFTIPRNQFALIPDIILIKGEKKIILDTKWKSLNNNLQKNYGISQSDMYQMYAYSKKYHINDIWLLYPINEEIEKLDSIKFESGDGTRVSLYFIDLRDINTNIKELKKIL